MPPAHSLGDFNMGSAKQEFEAEQEKRRHTDENCNRCSRELTKDELEFVENFGGEKFCEDCRAIQAKMEKE